ncbi:MAG: cysteine synthase A [Oscillospiraceae bacterium]|nr:cysteine synthase A [Oscillospiraceae bacterium]
MSRIYTSADQLIGCTPLLALAHIEKNEKLHARVLAKLEYFNPAGSAKDRVALSMILDAEEKGLLQKGSTIIEPTSGNTGIGLACVAAARGYRTIIVMPDSMSAERCMLMGAYGAELVLTPGAQGMSGAIAKAEELTREIPGSFIPDQFGNPANAKAHFETTGPEIWADTDGNVDIFVAGVGTGGTITGVGRFLKEKNPAVQVVAVEPYDSPLLSGGKAGSHGLQGIGANFVPAVLDTTVYDCIIPVTTGEAYAAARMMGKTEGILVGISSGAALHAALELAKKEENAGKNIVVLLPDTGDRYLSTDLFKE